MATDRNGKTVVAGAVYALAGKVRRIDGDNLLVVFGDGAEMKARVSAPDVALVDDMLAGGGPGGGAPTDATYLLQSADAALTDAYVYDDTTGDLNGTFATSPSRTFVLSIKDGAVVASKIATNAVTSAAIASGAVGTDELASDAVTAAKIAAGAVGTTEIAAGAVTTAKLAAAAVDTTQLADDAVTAEKLADGAAAPNGIETVVRVADINLPNGFVATNNVWTSWDFDQVAKTVGIKISSGGVTNLEIADATIETANLADDSVTFAKMLNATGRSVIGASGAGAFSQLEIPDGGGLGVTAGKLVRSALIGDVTAAEDSNVLTIAAGAVDTGHIADDAVTQAKIDEGAVGTTELAAGAVTNAKVAADAIDTAQLADGAVDFARLAAELKKTPWIECHPRTACLRSTGNADLVQFVGNVSDIWCLRYDDSADEYAEWTTTIDNYDGNGFEIEIHWIADTATSGNIKWETKVAIYAEGENANVPGSGYFNAVTAVDSHTGTAAAKSFHRIVVTNTNDAGKSGTAHFRLLLGRLGSDAADTLSGDVFVPMVRIRYGRSAA